MKKLLFLLTICICFSACNNDEVERLKKENDALKSKINASSQINQNQAKNPSNQIGTLVNTETTAKTKAQQIVRNYLLAETAKKRADFVLNPKEEFPRMKKLYGDINTAWENGSFQFGEDRKLTEYYLVDVFSDNPAISTYVLKETSSGLKIDWAVSILLNGQNPMLDNTKKMKLDMDDKKHHLLVIIEASTYYPVLNFFADKQQIYYSFMMDDKSKEHEKSHGYCAKNKISCQKLFEELKEKNKCVVSLDAWYPKEVLESPYSMSKTMQMEIDNIQMKFCW